MRQAASRDGIYVVPFVLEAEGTLGNGLLYEAGVCAAGRLAAGLQELERPLLREKFVVN